MAGNDRSQVHVVTQPNAAPSESADPLLERLRSEPWEFDFFRAGRLLECRRSDLPRIGESVSPDQDAVRFCQEPSLRFPAATIESFRPEARSTSGRPVPARVGVNFLGLLGPTGPMPLAFTDYVRARRARGDRGLGRFLDVFHHRMVSLFYRAWAVHQRTVGFDRMREDPWAAYLGSLFGIGMPSMRNRDNVSDVAKLHFTGRLSCQTRNADGLAAILESYFGVPARVEQFVGDYIDIPDEHRCRLGGSSDTGVLGQNALVGSRVWDCSHKFRIRMGPMNFRDYFRLLPCGSSLARLTTWVRNYAGLELDWDVQLVLKSRQVPRLALGKVGHLGWSTWLCTHAPRHDREDLVLNPAA